MVLLSPTSGRVEWEPLPKLLEIIRDFSRDLGFSYFRAHEYLSHTCIEGPFGSACKLGAPFSGVHYGEASCSWRSVLLSFISIRFNLSHPRSPNPNLYVGSEAFIGCVWVDILNVCRARGVHAAKLRHQKRGHLRLLSS